MADTLKRYMQVITGGANTTCTPDSSSTKTLLSCQVTNTSATDITFDMFATNSGGDHPVLNNQSLPASATFIFNSKIVFEGSGEYLKIDPSASVSAIHVVTSYLDQT